MVPSFKMRAEVGVVLFVQVCVDAVCDSNRTVPIIRDSLNMDTPMCALNEAKVLRSSWNLSVGTPMARAAGLYEYR